MDFGTSLYSIYRFISGIGSEIAYIIVRTPSTSRRLIVNIGDAPAEINMQ